uniref:Uncharacterized protein n=1 Tax=Romanomermis culicivorax TaxID=13658 RepID=A0A915KSU1_ROMCU
MYRLYSMVLSTLLSYLNGYDHGLLITHLPLVVVSAGISANGNVLDIGSQTVGLADCLIGTEMNPSCPGRSQCGIRPCTLIRQRAKTSPFFVRSCRPVLRIGRFVDIHGDSERSVIDLAVYVYFLLLFHVTKLYKLRRKMDLQKIELDRNFAKIV